MMNNDGGAAPAVVLRDLTVVRGGKRALDAVSLAIPRGQVTGLLGPSGCGKTTLIRSVVGVQVVASGGVEVLGEPAGSAGLRSRIGYVTQDASVYDDLTVAENLRFFARVRGVPREEAQQRIDQVDLTAYAGRPVHQLSGGQRSRVSLAVALLGDPGVLVLDEPTVGLDPVLREQLWELFHGFAREGTTVLVSSHVMDEAERCHRLVLMRAGTVLAEDTPAGLLTRTGAANVEAAFLGLVRGPGDRSEPTEPTEPAGPAEPAEPAEPAGSPGAHRAEGRRADRNGTDPDRTGPGRTDPDGTDPERAGTSGAPR